jgi:hypothetical protein
MSTELVVVVGHSQTTILGEMQTRPGRHLSILESIPLPKDPAEGLSQMLLSLLLPTFDFEI